MSTHRLPLGSPGLVSYRDDPTMASPQYDDARSPALHSPPAHDPKADPARPPLLNIRSSVPLIPTPGTVSKRNPTYVRYILFLVEFQG